MVIIKHDWDKQFFLINVSKFLQTELLTDTLLTGYYYNMIHVNYFNVKVSKISGSHGDEYEDDSFQGYIAV
jgi:hypothetical protein